VLNIQRTGTKGKEAMVLLHGWGMNSAVWAPLVPYLEKDFDLYLIDLPGHGQSEEVNGDLLSWTSVIDEVLPAECHLSGWSLGGVLALSLSKNSKKQIKSVVLISSSPCFVQADEWPGIECSVLEQFADNLQQDLPATLQTFLALQFYGTKEYRSGARKLQTEIMKGGLPKPQALSTGLLFLQHEDWRSWFALQNNIHVVLGAKDKLVPVAVKDHLKDINEQANISVITEAGHAPFVTHPERVGQALLFASEQA